ncbi:3-hydroxyacyl-CoA dehydrogenase NAD-binding domain-containing protein [Arthrobacter sp. ISL-95]|uniref:3-hydroxyacyl-CoA dehydrogenase NAD-binding domain-containing protein n=1 Tax=Arthrobacter sp. ISL-95 TaxID=2819116 RepID=UPI001BE6A30F|nr:3-hydroxyacyl-CoA dehydrogenase NAD-binding domain-containing protein [Arthrobacter sp. ISL-95]MBT2588437.1 enoyl-CoA hydratase/isomerase family protein [Arthrobacter sp. ISL-95]
MTQPGDLGAQPIRRLSPNAQLTEVQLPGAGTFALITLTGGEGKPATFGPESMEALRALLQELAERVDAGHVAGVGITGQNRFFVAGADLKALKGVKDLESARVIARLGHQVFGAIAALDVPTFAFINGAAVGGGLEVALAARYRTISTGAKAISLPEAYLGLVPGWGGVYRLPRLIGPANAVKVMIGNPLSNNKVLDGRSAYALGIADAIFDSPDFLSQSLAWADGIITDAARRQELDERQASIAGSTKEEWDAAVAAGWAIVESKTSNAAPAPARLLELLEQGRSLDQAQSADLEVNALGELILTPQFKDSVYAFLELLQRRAKNPSLAPNPALARNIDRIGVVGAGLMACQLTLLFVRELRVPVVMTDLDQDRVDKGVSYVHAQADKLFGQKRISLDDANRIKGLVSGSVSKSALADADFVIEAVFEDLSVKKHVLAEIESVVSEECILATNTSSLLVTEMAADLLHPERVVGFHFFNPVAAMPLLEIVQAAKTSDEALATAFVLGRTLKKTSVLVRDSTAFVVNRVLLRLVAEVLRAFDEGTPAEVADKALKPMGLPMTPFTLLAMIGFPVAQHAMESLNNAFGTRFPLSANLQKLIDHGITSLWTSDPCVSPHIPRSTLGILELADCPATSEQLLERVQDALAQEIGLLLDEGVVTSAEDVDLCMMAGAGWPLHLGGITPYLDRTGASQRVNGKPFHLDRG